LCHDLGLIAEEAMGLEKRPLNEGARAFIVERLEAAGPLGERLVKTGLRGGRLFTIADTEVPAEQLHAFHDAGVAPQSPIIQGDGHRIQRVQRPSQEDLRAVLAAYLDDPDTCVIAEEGLSYPSDPWLATLPETGVVVAPFAETDVFLVVLPGPDQDSRLTMLLRRVDSFFGFIAVTRADDDLAWTSLRPSDLDRIATDVRLIAVPAYDAEGYVIWEMAEA
jgi:hypothetical protein